LSEKDDARYRDLKMAVIQLTGVSISLWTALNAVRLASVAGWDQDNIDKLAKAQKEISDRLDEVLATLRGDQNAS
jgi:hypothetical protein